MKFLFLPILLFVFFLGLFLLAGLAERCNEVWH